MPKTSSSLPHPNPNWHLHHHAACRPRFLSFSHTSSLDNYLGGHRKVGKIQAVYPLFIFLITFTSDRWAHVGVITHLSVGIPWYTCFFAFTQVRWLIALNTDRSTLVPNPSFIPHTSSCSIRPNVRPEESIHGAFSLKICRKHIAEIYWYSVLLILLKKFLCVNVFFLAKSPSRLILLLLFISMNSSSWSEPHSSFNIWIEIWRVHT